MKIRSLVIAALGLGLAVAVPAAAQAYTSYTTGSVNFRSYPSVGSHVYGALPPGTPVNVFYCQPGWCRGSTFLGTGWVSSSYLSVAGPRAYPRVYRAPYPYYRPYPYRPHPRYYRRYPRSGFGFYFRVP